MISYYRNTIELVVELLRGGALYRQLLQSHSSQRQYGCPTHTSYRYVLPVVNSICLKDAFRATYTTPFSAVHKTMRRAFEGVEWLKYAWCERENKHCCAVFRARYLCTFYAPMDVRKERQRKDCISAPSISWSGARLSLHVILIHATTPKSSGAFISADGCFISQLWDIGPLLTGLPCRSGQKRNSSWLERHYSADATLCGVHLRGKIVSRDICTCAVTVGLVEPRLTCYCFLGTSNELMSGRPGIDNHYF